ncbi:SgcJ/EcaC family oxidoreductase [Streptomyces sp. LARHCF249]
MTNAPKAPNARKTRIRVALVAAAAAAAATVTVGVSAATPEKAAPAKPSKQQIAALFDTWNTALQTGDAEKVADLYAPDAVLLPTLSPEIRTDRAGIVDYMEHFLENKPRGVKVETVINVLDGDSAIDTGLYDFHVTDPETGEKKTVKARYTYEYEKRNGQWKIVNHHSSALPAAG